MGYKEKIQKYKDGTLSEDERRDLEQEMEKIRKISDYIYGLELSESADFSKREWLPEPLSSRLSCF